MTHNSQLQYFCAIFCLFCPLVVSGRLACYLQRVEVERHCAPRVRTLVKLMVLVIIKWGYCSIFNSRGLRWFSSIGIPCNTNVFIGTPNPLWMSCLPFNLINRHTLSPVGLGSKLSSLCVAVPSGGLDPFSVSGRS